jgi:hypothetical protein
MQLAVGQVLSVHDQMHILGEVYGLWRVTRRPARTGRIFPFHAEGYFLSNHVQEFARLTASIRPKSAPTLLNY